MYRVLLVDDEPLELDVLRDYTDWSSMDMQVVGTAENGQAALACLESCRPDIVLTDVKMPVMDGLAFARKARALLPRLKIVFMSAHNDFEKAQQAFQVDAFAYILKPVDEGELREVMDKVRCRCQEEKSFSYAVGTLQRNLLADLLVERTETGRAALLSAYGNLSGNSFDDVFFLFHFSVAHDAQKCEESPIRRESEDARVYEALSVRLADACPRGCLIDLHGGCFCYLRPALDPVTTPDDLHDELESLRAAVSAETGLPFRVGSDGMPHGLVGLADALDRAAEIAGAGPPSEPGREPSLPLATPDRSAEVVEPVVRYIREHFAQPISIEELAHRVFLSSNYLRAVFRKATNETIAEMQTRLRMEKAEELLLDPRLKIKDVATELGYEYSSHFIAHFDKFRGMTPTEYRRRHAGRS